MMHFWQVLDCMFLKARALATTGDWSASDAAYDEIIKKEKASTGKMIDATMEKSKNALFNMVRLLYCANQTTFFTHLCTFRRK